LSLEGIALAPPDLQASLRQQQAGNLDAAIAGYRAVLQQEPHHAEAHRLLGLALFARGEVAPARAALESAASLAPPNAALLNDLGNARRAAGDKAAAVEAFSAAISSDPGFAFAHFNLADALLEAGEIARANAAYDDIIARGFEGVDGDFHLNRGLCRLRLGDAPGALEAFRAALALEPGHGRAAAALSDTLQRLVQHREAVIFLTGFLDKQRASLETLLSLGSGFLGLRDYPRALGLFERLAAIKPPPAKALIGKGLALSGHIHAKLSLWDWGGFLEQRQELLALLRSGGSVADPFALLGMCDDPELHQIAARTYTRETLPRRPVVQPLSAQPGDKLRIGYFSAEFHDHATMHLLAGVLECHDRDAFEIHAFSYGPDTEDTMRARIRATVDHFHDCARMSDGAITAMARQAGIDIAVDLNGYTQDARLAPFAARLAPVQISYLGYPGTVGADFLDYIIADATALPMDQQRFYDEKIIHLPDSYQANDDRRAIAPETPSRAEAGLPAKGFVYCCFNNPYKITPEGFASWMRILNAVPDSVLWLLTNEAEAMDRLRAVATGQGIDPARLVFAPQLPSAQHLARHRLADLFLDTLPYNAHTTASDALWAGLPVLTQMGQAFAGRVAASLLNAIGMPELITRDTTEYEALAIALGRDPARAAALKAKLAAAIPTAPLFNTPRFTRHLEAAYRLMWQRHAAGLAPEGFAVPAED
jgi:predicted O-linked N-acetylglucosamine transferase (SPINDLY family)